MESPEEIKEVAVKMLCSWCGHRWYENLNREQLRQLAANEYETKCPTCKQTT